MVTNLINKGRAVCENIFVDKTEYSVCYGKHVIYN